MMDLFLTWTSLYTPTNPHPSTENLHTPTFMSATIPVPPLPPKTVSSDPLQDKLTSYAPQHLQKELDTVYTTSLQNGHPAESLTESNASCNGQCQTKTREP